MNHDPLEITLEKFEVDIATTREAVPGPIITPKKDKLISFRTNAHNYARLKALADTQNISISMYINYLIEKELKQHG